MEQEQIQTLIERGALFAVNHSGGKDSQAMFIRIAKLVPREHIVVVHADLGEVEWPGTKDHAYGTTAEAGFIAPEQFIVAKSVKTFMQMVDHRKNWPSPENRQCTSDLKRGPIEREIRHRGRTA